MSELNQSKKIILFSTRFLENEDYLFSRGNYYDDDKNNDKNIKSSEFKKYFLSKDTLLSIGVNIDTINYFNRIICFNFFKQYKDEKNKPLISIEDSYHTIREKIRGNIPQEQRKSLVDIIRKFDKNPENKFLAIKICEGKFCVEEANDEEIESCYDGILKLEGQSINKDVILNTDFGKAIDKRTIDRRFKIYKLRTGNSKDYSNYSVYAVWCLSVGSSKKAESWYKALYEELKSQLGNEFDEVDEILYFLHDGDIDAKKPFDVISYKESIFSFLDKEKKLSIAIFDHSNSPLAKALRTHDVDKAIKMAEDAMESGGKRGFLNKLSDCISRWTVGGNKEYIKETTKDKLEKFNITLEYMGKDEKDEKTLLYRGKDVSIDDVSVSDIYQDVKKQIDIFESSL